MYDLQDSIKSLPLDASGTVSWIHIGDTHLTRSGEQNEVDLGNIVDCRFDTSRGFWQCFYENFR